MNKTIEKIIKERQTVKAYSEKHIPQEDWQQIVDVIEWSPTSFGSEPYRVLVINRSEKTKALREELQKSMWGQGVVVEADKIVFFIAYDEHIVLDKKWVFERNLRKAEQLGGLKGEAARDQAQKMADHFVGHIKKYEPHVAQWSARQAYIALGNAMSAATILNIGSTPMEGFNRDELEVVFKKHKLIKPHEYLAVAAAFGYPKSETAYAHWGSGKRVREPIAEKFTVIE